MTAGNLYLRFSIFLLLAFYFNSSYSLDPVFRITATGSVIDFILEKNILYAATDQGVVDIFDIKSGEKIDQLILPSIKDFMGDNIPPKIFSIDKIDDNILLVVQGKRGFRDVVVYSGKEFEKIIDSGNDKMLIIEARYFNKDKIVLGLLSNEILLYDIPGRSVLYKTHVSNYSLSDFCLNEDKSKIFIADESGILRMVDTQTGEVIREFEGNNVDRVYKLDYKNGIIAGGGQDRRLGIYDIRADTKYFLQEDFLIYCVGLSNDGNLCAYSVNENNDVCIIEVETKQKMHILSGQESTLTKILFSSDNTLITSGEDPEILFWKLN